MKSSVVVSIPAVPANNYSILVDSDCENSIISWLEKHIKFSQLVVVTDNKVKKLFAAAFAEKLKLRGHKVLLASFPAGERAKNAVTKQSLEELMLRHRCGRDTICIAFGGGVVGDMAGFLAATYMRGIPFVQIPTTLLAMVDSSVGGKTGIDTAYGKNLIGAFWQPKAVFSDMKFLLDLPELHLVCGIVEAVKMFLTNDAQSFAYVKKNIKKILSKDVATLKKLVLHAVKIKAQVVALDEKEQGMRMVLNFGHTIGHALEHLSEYKMLHGYAVGLGIIVEAKIAELLGVLSQKSYMEVAKIFCDLGIKLTDLQKFSVDAIVKATQLDKKVCKGKVRYVLLQDIGSVVVKGASYAHPVSDAIVKAALVSLLDSSRKSHVRK